jgi:hypothetical protein
MTYRDEQDMINRIVVLMRLIEAARMVVAFDGTDRDSLDELREAVYEFGVIVAQVRDELDE